MVVNPRRPRRHSSRILPLLAPLALLALAACTATSDQYPNSTFQHTTEFNTAVDGLFDRMMFLGTAVFVLVEAMLVYTLFRFRRREGQRDPEHVHGNTTLEIIWTAIPALILVFIAVPTVRTIFRTQAKSVPNALQVEVIGHQWWWEFRYPQYTARRPNGKVDTLITANELYLPTGRTVNFALKTRDVLHSFWIPRLGGKRDLINNHTNYLWFTPVDSVAGKALNGSCNEYCGASHANMKFRTFVVTPTEFESWARHQAGPAVFGPPRPPGAGVPGAPVPPPPSTTAPPARTADAGAPANVTLASNPHAGHEAGNGLTTTASAGALALQQPGAAPGAAPGKQSPQQPVPTNVQVPANPAAASAAPSTGYEFPGALPNYALPHTPVPASLAFDDNLRGDAGRGRAIVTNIGRAPCLTCHVIAGELQVIPHDRAPGPNLTHIGSRKTIASALYPNDARHLARWIKNSPAMKPGSYMPALGRGQFDPVRKTTVGQAGLSDQDIADIVAYLQALK